MQITHRGRDSSPGSTTMNPFFMLSWTVLSLRHVTKSL